MSPNSNTHSAPRVSISSATLRNYRATPRQIDTIVKRWPPGGGRTATRPCNYAVTTSRSRCTDQQVAPRHVNCRRLPTRGVYRRICRINFGDAPTQISARPGPTAPINANSHEMEPHAREPNEIPKLQDGGRAPGEEIKLSNTSCKQHAASQQSCGHRGVHGTSRSNIRKHLPSDCDTPTPLPPTCPLPDTSGSAPLHARSAAQA